MQARKLSKFLSLVLRHRPEKIGIQLDEAGWVEVDVLLEAITRHGLRVSREQLEQVVRTNDKQRFALSEDGRRIRAVQGHSIPVSLGYAPAKPPEILLHGTTAAFLSAIRRDGLQRMKRHHVHLHADQATAKAVGGRRGKPVVLKVHAGRMARDGYEFFRAPNNVWLTDHVPPEYIEFPEHSQRSPE